MQPVSVPVTFFDGIVIRRRALMERGIRMEHVLSTFEVGRPLAESADLLSFGPHFGPEAADEFVRRLLALGFVYPDDFFHLTWDHPDWLRFRATLGDEE